MSGSSSPETRGTPFTVRCRGCEATLMTLARVGEEEVARLRRHLAACPLSDPIGERAPLGEVMRRLSVTKARPEKC